MEYPPSMTFQKTTSHDGILLNTLQASSMLPQRHVNQASPHKDIWIPSTFNDLLMSTTAHFNCNYIGTCIQNPHKSNRVWLHTFLAFVEIVEVPSSNAHILHVLIPWHSTWPHYMMASCRTLSKHPPCSRKDISTKLFPTKTSDQQSLSMRCSWRHLPSSSATTLVDALAPPQRTCIIDPTHVCFQASTLVWFYGI